MAQDVTIAGASYEDVPSIDVPTTGGGTSSFFDVSDTTANAADVASGKVFYAADGVQTVGTASGGSGVSVFYGTCSTAAATQTKAVVCEEFTSADLVAGTVVNVKFTNAQTYNGAPTLNVQSTGAKNVKRIGTTNAARYEWQAGEVLQFVYDGTYWMLTDGGIATTTYYGVTKLSSATNSTSTSLAATASAVKAAYDHADGKQDALVSGTNIKTINGTSILGSGDIAISGGADFKLVPVFVRSTSNTRATVAIPDVGPDDVVVVFSSFANNDTSHFGNFATYRPYVEKNVNGNVTFKFAANLSGNSIGMLVAVISSLELQVFGMDSATVSNRKPSVGETITVTGSGASGNYSLGYVDTVTGETVTYANLSDVSTYTGSFVMPSHSVYLISSFSGGGDN